MTIATEKTPHEILVGPAGWSYADWAGIVYPSRRPTGFHEAEYLAEYFDTIEINTSFYHPMRADMARKWVERIRKNRRFLFTAKLWRRFTHESGGTREDEAEAKAGFDALAQEGRLGAVLLQFPFSFHNTPENFARMKELLKRFREYPLAVEVRHLTWNDPKFYEMLHRQRAGFCNIDQPVIGRSLKPSERATGAVGYVRLHGRRYDTWFSDDPKSPPAERYNYLYSEAELEPWTGRIEHVAERAKTTFVITNNHFQGKGVVNALELIHALTGKKVKTPEPLRQAYPRLDAIASEPVKEPTLFPLEARQKS